jgi:hypothetical protein
MGYLVTMPDDTVRFWCVHCVGKTLPDVNGLTAVYRINIGIYSQVCDECDTLIVDGVKKQDNSPLCLFGQTA